MKKVMIEFPVVGYAEVEIEVADDVELDDIPYMIEDGEIDVVYDGHSHAETLRPMFDISEARMFTDIPSRLQVVE